MLKQKIFTYTIITLIFFLITFSWEYFRETKFKATFETHPIISTNISKNYQNYDYQLENFLLKIHNDNHIFLRDHLLDNFRKSETIINPRFVSIRDNDMTYFIFSMEFKELENAKKEIFDQINFFKNFIKKRTIQMTKHQLNLISEDNQLVTLIDVGRDALNNQEIYLEIVNLIKEYSREMQSAKYLKLVEIYELNIKTNEFLKDLKLIYNNFDKKINNLNRDKKKKLEEDAKTRKLYYQKILKEIQSTEQFFIFQNLQFKSNKNYTLSLILSILAGMAVSFLFFEILRKKNIRYGIGR